jgi:lipoprotein-anchoring transpeptidase ErfK/SrfK
MTYRRYRTIPKWRRVATFFALLLLSVGAATAARADQGGGALSASGPARIEHGVAIRGTLVGGMTTEQATTAVQASFRRPIAIAVDHQTFYVSPARLGGVPLVASAIERAQAAGANEDIPLGILVDRPRLAAAAKALAKKYSRPAVNAKVALRKLRPTVVPERAGYAVHPRPLVRALESALRAGGRGPVAAPHSKLEARLTEAEAWPVIVIRRAENRLLLYGGERKPKVFGVATGQPAYPTPLGRFTIVSKQLNPWWYPPNSDWARGLSPVPPGPGNPLGTRWMGLSLPEVGIHGTPDAASIGYSASHGCIRMRIPDAEWLFEHVSEGTTVFIV